MKMRNRRENGRRRSVATLAKNRISATILAVAAILTVGWGNVQRASADEPNGDKAWRPVAVVASAGYDAVWGAAERVAKELKFAEAVDHQSGQSIRLGVDKAASAVGGVELQKTAELCRFPEPLGEKFPSGLKIFVKTPYSADQL